MSHTITGKLNRAPNQFQAGTSTGLGFNLGVKYRDPSTRQYDYVNYKVVVFVGQNSGNLLSFYQQNLVEGAIVSVSADSQMIETYQKNDGTDAHNIVMLNAKIEYLFNPNGQKNNAQSQQNANAQNGVGYQNMNTNAMNYQSAQNGAAQPQQNVPAQPAVESHSNFDDDILF